MATLAGVALVLLIPVVVVGFLVVAEWLLVLAILPILTLIRAAWGMPWIVVARRWEGKGMRTRHSGQVKGWRESRELIERVSAELKTHGVPQSLACRQSQATGSDS